METHAVYSKQIQRMFAAIAPWYDFLNRLLSLGRDQYWRKAAVNAMKLEPGQRILDLATGTADVALEIGGRFRNNIKVCGVDFSRKMLQLAVVKANRKGLRATISFQAGKGEELPFTGERFHGVIVAFGIRNFDDIYQGLMEICRVLKSGHRLVILEFSIPKGRLFQWLYLFYFQMILPRIGQRVSGHDTAYHYLPQSVTTFPDRKEFVNLLHQTGFKNISIMDLTLGITTLYIAQKSEPA